MIIGEETRVSIVSFYPEETQFCSGQGDNETVEHVVRDREISQGTRLMYVRHSSDYSCIWYQLPPDHEHPGLVAYVRIRLPDIHALTEKI